jgi:hypothetical protein
MKGPLRHLPLEPETPKVTVVVLESPSGQRQDGKYVLRPTIPVLVPRFSGTPSQGLVAAVTVDGDATVITANFKDEKGKICHKSLPIERFEEINPNLRIEFSTMKKRVATSLGKKTREALLKLFGI